MREMGDEEIVFSHIVKTYRNRRLVGILPPRFERREIRALDGLSFTVRNGEVFGLLGPNGAGKTTTVQILSGLLIPDEGEARVCGIDPVGEPDRVKRIVGVVAGGNPRQLYNKLTARENLRYWGQLHGMSGWRLERRIDELIELIGLKDRADDVVEKFSMGMTQRVILARGLLHDPEVLLLDEPTVGLDPKASREMRAFIRQRLVDEREKTVILTTHEMHVAEELCDRIAIINHGRLVALGTPGELRRQVIGGTRLEVDVENPDDDLIETMRGMGLEVVGEVTVQNGTELTRLTIRTEREEEALQTVVEAILKSPAARLRRMTLREPTLEDAFVSLTDESETEAEVNA